MGFRLKQGNPCKNDFVDLTFLAVEFHGKSFEPTNSLLVEETQRNNDLIIGFTVEILKVW